VNNDRHTHVVETTTEVEAAGIEPASADAPE